MRVFGLLFEKISFQLQSMLVAIQSQCQRGEYERYITKQITVNTELFSFGVTLERLLA